LVSHSKLGMFTPRNRTLQLLAFWMEVPLTCKAEGAAMSSRTGSRKETRSAVKNVTNRAGMWNAWWFSDRIHDPWVKGETLKR